MSSTGQLAPTENLGAHVFLAAGAGSGKTRALVERYVRCLADPRLRLDQVVAVTFTEKAAAEMKERVRQRCRELAQTDGRARFWRERERGLENAPVSTIHSLCAQILRENAVAAGVDPSFEVLDEERAELLREEVVEQAVLLRAEESPNMRLLLGALGFDDLCAEFVRWLNHRDQWQDINPDDRAFERATVAYINAWRKRVVAALGRAVQGLTPEALAQETAKGKQIAEELLNAFNTYAAAKGSSAKGETLAQALASIKPLLILREIVKGRGGKKGGAVAAALRRLREPLKSAPQYDEDVELFAAQASAAFFSELRVVAEAYDRAKEELPALDFDDLLVRCRDLLRDNPAVRAKYVRRIRHLLIDEFQDTDRIQRELLWYLAGAQPGAAGPRFPPRGARLFVVGDEKQSIYRFRRADVSVFSETREQFRACADERCLCAELNNNYRSTEALVHGIINPMFSHPALMGTGEPEDPHEARYMPMTAQRRLPARAPALDLIVALPPPDAEDKPSLDQVREIEAHAVAQRILELHGTLAVEDPERGKRRRARYADFAILFRASTPMPIFERALREHNIPFHSVRGRGLYHQQEVRDLINLLLAIDRPEDAVALMGFLRSPMVGLSDETLYWLARDGGLLAGVRRVERGATNDGALRHIAPEELARLRRGLEVLAHLREVKDRLPASELLRRAMELTGYTAALAGLFAGKQRVANVRRVIEVAAEFDAAGDMLLCDLANYLRDLVTREPREAAAPIFAENADVVTLTTIHSAKGLEWPIVIVADLGRDERPSGAGKVLLHPSAGFVLRGEDAAGERKWPLLYREAKEREERLSAYENRRLFYVACTRARDHLVLSGSAKSEKGPAKNSCLARVCEALGVDVNAEPGPYPVPGAPQGEQFNLVFAQAVAEREAPVPLAPARHDMPAEAIARRILPLPWRVAKPRLAVTEVSLGLRCPWALHLSVNEGIAEYGPPSAGEGQSTALARGAAAHRVLEWLARRGADATSAQEVAPLLAAAADEAGWLPAERELQALAANIAALWSGVRKTFGGEAQVQPELVVAFQLNGAVLEGKIDAVVRTADGALHLLDYKTGRLGPEREEEYLFQVALYCHAVEGAGEPRPSSALVLSVDEPGTTLRLDPQNQLADLVRRAVDLVEALKNGTLKPAPRAPCSRCPYAWACAHASADLPNRTAP